MTGNQLPYEFAVIGHQPTWDNVLSIIAAIREEDKDSLKPFARIDQVVEQVWQAAFDNGIAVYSSTGLAGSDGDAFVVAPPFIATAADLELAVEKIRTAVTEVLG